MARKILIVFGVVVVLLVGFIASRPSTFRVERKQVVAAPQAVVFTLVNDFHRWGEWSPWEKLDPSMKKTFEGPEAGVGAIYAWVGNDEVGEGKMTVVESRPNEFVGITLEFIKPFASTARSDLTLTPAGEGTEVSWVMSGPQDFMSKAMSVVMDLDRMIGTDFEKGLITLNAAAIDETAKTAVPEEPEPVDEQAVEAEPADPDADGGVAAPEGDAPAAPAN